VRELFRRAGGLDVFGVEVDHVAEREGWCGGAAAVIIPCHVVLCLGQCRLGFLEGVLHLICEFINHFEAGRRLMRFEAHPRVSAGIEEGKECVPVILPFSDEDPQVLFQLLVDPFRLSVGLRVVGGRRRGFDS